MVPSILRQFLTTVFILVIFAHCSKLEKRKKWKTLIIFFEAIICQTDGLSSNSRVTEKIEEWVNSVSFKHVQLKFGKLKKRLACLHTALGSALKSSPFFSFFFLYSCPPMYPYYLAWSTENQPTRFSLHIQLQLLCWKTMLLLLHTDPNAKKILHKRPETKNGMGNISGYFSLLSQWKMLVLVNGNKLKIDRQQQLKQQLLGVILCFLVIISIVSLCINVLD